jgi:hypothetical protein
MVLGKLATYMQKTETRVLSLTLYKNNSKWIKDCNVRPKILKQEQTNIKKTLEDIGKSKYFLKGLIGLEIRARTDIRDCIKLK